MFDKATRLKLRFDTARGSITTEDLWDLPLQTTRPNGVSLDIIAIGLDREIKDSATASFVDDSPKANEELQLKFDVVKHIIDVKKAENVAIVEQRDRAAKKARILEIIAKKQDASLENASIEELTAMVGSL